MGILALIRRCVLGKPSTNLGPIGNTEPVCPYCRRDLARRPAKKAKCSHCGKFIYVRTRPADRRQVLVTEAQAEQIEEQWSIVNGTHREFLASRRQFWAEKDSLRDRLGREPADTDVQWSLLNNELAAHAANQDWGHYRNAKLGMAEILRRQSKLQQALEAYLEVCYLDLNGPSNAGSYRRDAALLRKYPPFDPRGQGFLAPEVLRRAGRIISKLHSDPGDVQRLFERVAGPLEKSLRLPLAAPHAWKKIAAGLF